MKRIASILLGLALLAPALSAQTPAPGKPKKKAKAAHTQKVPTMITTDSGLKYLDSAEGAGPSPTKGQTCVMHYTGYLSDQGKPGQKFDSSVGRGPSPSPSAWARSSRAGTRAWPP